VITDAITNATSSVWIEMYEWTNPHVMQALLQRKNQANTANQPFDVQLMLYEQAPANTYNPSHFTAPDGSDFTLSSSIETIAQLQQLNMGIQASFCNAVVDTEKHAKFMVIDGKTAYIMTANFTEVALGGSSYSNWPAHVIGEVVHALGAALTHGATTGGSRPEINREYIVVDNDANDVHALKTLFQNDWNQQAPDFTTLYASAPNLLISGSNARPNPTNSRVLLNALINFACQQSSDIAIEMETLCDESPGAGIGSIEQALIDAARQGITVRIILSYMAGQSIDTSNAQAIQTLTAALQSQSPQKLFIRKDTKKYMHAKLILTEGMAFVGSQNLTPGGLAWNREVGILVSDTTALGQLKQAFESDWDESTDVSALN